MSVTSPEVKGIEAPRFVFCPFCARKLAVRVDDGKERRHCDACDWTYYPRVAMSVVGLLCSGGRVLLVKRRFEPCAGTWVFPSGFVEYGEHPEIALRREILEETGYSIERYSLKQVCQSWDDAREPGQIVFFFDVQSWQGELSNDPEENEEIGWFSFTELPPVDLPLHRQILSGLKNFA